MLGTKADLKSGDVLLVFNILFYWLVMPPSSTWKGYALNTNIKSLDFEEIAMHSTGFTISDGDHQRCTQDPHYFYLTYQVGLKLGMFAPTKLIECVGFHSTSKVPRWLPKAPGPVGDRKHHKNNYNTSQANV